MTFINERTYTPVDAPVSVAFLGLGVMGYPMAGHLAKAGHHVSVYNRTEAKAKTWVSDAQAAGANPTNLRVGTTPREAAQGAHIVMACVGNELAARSLTTPLLPQRSHANSTKPQSNWALPSSTARSLADKPARKTVP